MKIGILTHYNVNNQGARLQMYAMKYWLEEHGHEAVILTYEKNFDFDADEKKKNSASIANIGYYAQEYLFKKGPGLTLFNVRKVAALNGEFKGVRTAPYDHSGCDAVIIGSDEVFSVDVGCNRMMYGYGMGNVPVIAYAPSFGRTTPEELKKFNCYDLVSEGLSGNFRSLSARDVHTKEMILSMTGKDVPLVCDPVILYSGEKFRIPVKKIRKRYLLIYSYDRHMIDPGEIKEIRRYAKRRGLITVSLGTYHRWCDKNIACSSHQWFSYFRDAEAVLTDTFHGSVVAMKNHCNVAVYVRKSINAFKMKSLLKDAGLCDRELSEITAANLAKAYARKIDYSSVDRNMKNLALRSEEYLLRNLESL